MPRRCARKMERACCTLGKYLPVVFVYCLTTWAVWVVVVIGRVTPPGGWIGKDRRRTGTRTRTTTAPTTTTPTRRTTGVG